MKNEIIVVYGQGNEVVGVGCEQVTIGQFFDKLEKELEDTFDEGTISEFLLGSGEQVIEYKGCKCRVFFSSPENDWRIVVEYDEEVLQDIWERSESSDEVCELLGLDLI